MVVVAALFLAALFYTKNSASYSNKKVGPDGLVYSKEILGDLVSRDTDKDGIRDWEERLWGTDPTKADTDDDGIKDAIEIEKLKQAEQQKVDVKAGTSVSGGEEKLTETDKFSRELFASIASITQVGAADEATINKLSSKLAEGLKNSIVRKTFKSTDLKITQGDDRAAIQQYNDAIVAIYAKYKNRKSVTDVIREFLADEENTAILRQLDPIVSDYNKIIAELVATPVPSSFYLLHLSLINSSERVAENISDMRLFDSDIIVALGAFTQYEKNVTNLEFSATILSNALNKKLSN